jgi:hypothetical protein
VIRLLREDESPPDYVDQGAGKSFEDAVLNRLARESGNNRGTFNRYGVQTAVIGFDKQRGMPSLRAIKSYPDIEGLLVTGTQVVFDCKVCSQSSFDLAPFRLGDEQKGSKEKQLRHMVGRADYGAVCGFLIHWNSRTLRKSEEPTATFWFPVQREMPFWIRFWKGEERRINRKHCEEFGFPIQWNRKDSELKPWPDLLPVLERLDSRKVGKRNPRVLGSWV